MPVAVPALQGLLGDQRADVRRHALVCLRQLGPAAAEAAGDVARLLRDGDDGVRCEAIGVAVEVGALTPEHVPLLTEAIASESRSLREAAAAALAKLDAGVAVPACRACWATRGPMSDGTPSSACGSSGLRPRRPPMLS